MSYRKLYATFLFTGTKLLAGQVLIVSQDGTVVGMVPHEEADKDVEKFEGMLCPGFVNAHCHLELSHLKNAIEQQTGMVGFLLKVLSERNAPTEEKQQAMNRAMDAMKQRGIVAVGDICNTTDSISIKAANPEIYFHNFIEVSGFVPSAAKFRFNQSVAIKTAFDAVFPLKQTSITPHASYSVSPELMGQIAAQEPSLISIHNQESQAEEDFIKSKTGPMTSLYTTIGVNIEFFHAQRTSSLQYMFPLMPNASNILLVHNCHTNEEDVDFIINSRSKSRAHFCLCPNANLYIGNPLPNVSLFMKSGLPICIGTDSLASNQQLDILNELQTLQIHFPFLTIEILLQWATTNGAEALGINQQYGSFEKGKKPGVLLLKKMVEPFDLKDAVVERIL